MNRSAGEASEERPERGRGVLEGAFALLETLEDEQEAGLTALAAATGLPKTTAHRLLEQLTELGAVEHHGRRYRIGPRMLRLGRGSRPHPGLRAAADGPMRRLAGTTGAGICFCVLREGRTLAALTVPGMVDELGSLHAGASWPWTTAAGKLLVATRPDLPLNPVTDAWRREASAIRDHGVAVDREGLVPGVCCVAVPVTLGRGRVVGALCAMVDPAYDLKGLVRSVTQAGLTVSAGLRRP
ncbi:IclR family transcriptional regulator [Streptomyces sp. cg36]|uniref:IclR family transcriptional regulator n=1 Tax=Streptomyces sp. cg36 TaxID=3238798 RepID=UPI0034E285AE